MRSGVMHQSHRFGRAFLAFAWFVGSLLAVGTARGVVLHTGDTGVPAGSRPADAVAGRWFNNASCVAIAPDYLITTRHQLGGVGTSVEFAGVPYLVAEQTPLGTADLRVCRITKPD